MGGPVVLVVEDYPDQAELYAPWLQNQYTVRTAHSGEEALEQLDDNVRVVLSDRLLSGIGGDAVLIEFRDRGYPCQVTMVTSLEPAFDFVDLGLEDYLVKPVSKDELTDTVAR